MNDPSTAPTTNQEAYVQEIERRRQNGELDTAVPTTTTADIPVEARLQRAMQALEQVFPGCSIALVVAPFGADPGRRANYIGNGKRDDVRVLLKEVIARWEGLHQEAPARPQ